MSTVKENEEKEKKDPVADPENVERGEEWTEVDEELDETFPASDPPANY